MAMKKIALVNPPHTFTIIDSVTEALYFEDFNNSGFSLPHTLTEAEAISAFGWPYLLPRNAGTVHLVSDPSGGGRGAVLKVDLKEGQWALGQTEAQGCQMEINWSGGDKGEIYYAFDIFFPNDFIFNFICKMAKIQTTGSGGLPLGQYARVGPDWTGNNNFVTSLPKTPRGPNDGQIETYVYRAGRYRERILSDGFLQKGVWNRVEYHGLMNTPETSSNGEWSCWLNGQLIDTVTGVQFVNVVKNWNHCMFHIYSGGEGNEFRQPQNQSCYVDNLIVAENPITH